MTVVTRALEMDKPQGRSSKTARAGVVSTRKLKVKHSLYREPSDLSGGSPVRAMVTDQARVALIALARLLGRHAARQLPRSDVEPEAC